MKAEAQETFIKEYCRAHVLPSHGNERATEKPITVPLQDHLCRHYWGRAENLTAPRSHLTHITLFAERSYAQIFHRWRGELIFGHSSRPASLHVYDIAPDSFTLELRNVPMSVATRDYLETLKGAIDEGQSHMTTRLRLRATDVFPVRQLAQLVTMVPREGRIDRLGRCFAVSSMVGKSLLRLARVIEVFDPCAI